jgi:RNA polymerase sigma factor (sigma-70 family)
LDGKQHIKKQIEELANDETFRNNCLGIIGRFGLKGDDRMDIYQEAMENFLTHFKNGNPRAYFVTICKNLCFGREKRKPRMPTHEVADYVTPFDALVEKEAYEIVLSAMSQIEPSKKRILEQRYLLGEPIKELARQSKKSYNSTTARLSEAKRELRKSLPEYYEIGDII